MKSIRKVVKKAIPKNIFRAIEPTGHLLEAATISTLSGRPAKNMRIIGVTGTNGKTTTCFMIHRMLVEAGYNVAFMTTVAYGVGDNITPQVAHMTTVSAPELNTRIKDFKKQGVEWLVLEVTSHALAQYRVWGIPFEIAVMTNITHEHLDYHGTFTRYLQAKQRLFNLVARHKSGFAVINADDDHADQFTDIVQKSTTYGIKHGDLRAHNIDLRPDSSRYIAKVGNNRYAIQVNVPGEFNVSNSLAAIAVGRHLGLSKHQIEHGIAMLKGVEGRMDTIDAGQDFSVIIDFAHTPDSFERLLKDVRKSTKGKLIAVFGSAGRRDEAKRAIQGKIAGKYCNEIVLTEEDDRDIDGNEILNQIATGAEESGKTREKDLFLILDRSSAIEFAMKRAETKDDVVILLGKGHEKTIERADGEHPWNEADEARKAILAATKPKVV